MTTKQQLTLFLAKSWGCRRSEGRSERSLAGIGAARPGSRGVGWVVISGTIV